MRGILGGGRAVGRGCAGTHPGQKGGAEQIDLYPYGAVSVNLNRRRVPCPLGLTSTTHALCLDTAMELGMSVRIPFQLTALGSR